MTEAKRIVIAGGSGFIGTALACEFTRRNYHVIVLSRAPRERTDGVQEVAWNGEHIGEWVQYLDGAEAVINLTGKNINCPHTKNNLLQIHSSRVNSVFAIAAGIMHAKIPPRTWVQASAVGYYGDTREVACDEHSPNGTDALAKICQDWEGTSDYAKNFVKPPTLRKVVLRIGFVLGKNGGALPVLATLVRLFLGGTAGSGRQYISWIHISDLVQMFVAAVENEKLSGAFNAVAPNPVTNAEFMRELRHALHRPWSPPVPEFAVKLGARLMRGEPSLALTSQRCVSSRFGEIEFPFQFPNLPAALQNLCRQS